MRKVLPGVSLAGAILFLSSCASNAPQDTWKPKGRYARTIDTLQRPVFYVAGIVGVIVTVFVIVAVVKFRERPGEERLPYQSHGKTPVEVGLTALSAAILAVIAIPTVNVVFDLNKKPASPLEIKVIGQQWWWEYQYPSLGIVTSGELVIPAGTEVRLSITSRDVIHSFWIPALNGKKDAVPNRVHPLNMKADAPGVYEGQCTEFCGLSHANMRQRVVALSDADFKTWTEGQLKGAPKPAPDTAEARGEEAFIANCARCHSINGLVDAEGELVPNAADEQLVSGAAPNLTHLMSRSTFAGAMFKLNRDGCEAKPVGGVTGTAPECVDRAQLEAWLRDAPEEKPMYAELNENNQYRGMPNLGLSEQTIDDIVAYLLTLS